MSESTLRRRNGVTVRISRWIGHCQQELSDRVHSSGDEHASRQGWQITKSTGRFGFGARCYRDARFDQRFSEAVGGGYMPIKLVDRQMSRFLPEGSGGRANA